MSLVVLIAAGVATLVKFFGHKKDEKGSEIQGDHPVVRALTSAINLGDAASLDDLIDDRFRMWANGYALAMGETEEGAALLLETIDAYRSALPDIHWDLYDELSEGRGDEEELAFRFVSTATIDDREHQIEIAVFAKLEDKKLVEWREVLDMSVFNVRRQALGLDPID